MAWKFIMQDYKFLHLVFSGVWKAYFKQMRGCFNIEMCRIHLDEIMYRTPYFSNIFDSLLKDTAFF